jgi:hypothetical protein
MVRFIVQLLVVSLLTLNIAWAFDDCALTDPVQVSGVMLQAGDQFPDDSPGAALDCDDWCSAWFSPVALPGKIILHDFTPVTIIDSFYTLSFSSLPIPPPFHPPIV